MQLLLLNVHGGNLASQRWAVWNIVTNTWRWRTFSARTYKSVIGNGQLDAVVAKSLSLLCRLNNWNLIVPQPSPTSLLSCANDWLPPQVQLKQQAKCMVCHGYNDTNYILGTQCHAFLRIENQIFPPLLWAMEGNGGGYEWAMRGWSRCFGKILWKTELKSWLVMTYQPTCTYRPRHVTASSLHGERWTLAGIRRGGCCWHGDLNLPNTFGPIESLWGHLFWIPGL